MKTTQNLGLRKPDPEDFYDVGDFNYNADVIDQELTEAKATAQQANQTANQTASVLDAHLNDNVRHVTQEDKNEWNNKVSKNGDILNGDYTIIGYYPLQIKHPDDGKSWVIHRTTGIRKNNIIFAPKKNDDSDWDWEKQIEFTDDKSILFGYSLQLAIIAGQGSPEGNVVAKKGSIYLSDNGTVYIKTSGTGNTGWKAVQVS